LEDRRPDDLLAHDLLLGERRLRDLRSIRTARDCRYDAEDSGYNCKGDRQALHRVLLSRAIGHGLSLGAAAFPVVRARDVANVTAVTQTSASWSGRCSPTCPRRTSGSLSRSRAGGRSSAVKSSSTATIRRIRCTWSSEGGSACG